jgi:hypothetical protein
VLDYYLMLFALWLMAAGLLAGLGLSYRREETSRALGHITYQCISMAGLGFFAFLITAAASSTAYR